MGRNTAWTDEELGELESLRHLTAGQAAIALGRTRKQVLHMRQRIRRGWARQLEPISDWELDFVADYQHFTAAEIGRHLGRTTQSINAMRRKLRESGAIGSAPSAKSPWQVGARPLVAKTCSECGLLLDASWFASRCNTRPGHYQSRCRKCMAASNKARNKITRHTAKFAERLQALSLDTATRTRQEWTHAEMELLRDETKTNFEKAVTLGRSYYAVGSQMSKMGLRSRKPELGDPTEAQWYIHLREQMRIALTEAVAA